MQRRPPVIDIIHGSGFWRWSQCGVIPGASPQTAGEVTNDLRPHVLATLVLPMFVDVIVDGSSSGSIPNLSIATGRFCQQSFVFVRGLPQHITSGLQAVLFGDAVDVRSPFSCLRSSA